MTTSKDQVDRLKVDSYIIHHTPPYSLNKGE
nr:MAG TPA: hypothetical protein [Caudoviricetes sp.]